jgi:glycosyltransferase involved in cell wall biosynthesis
VAGPEQSSNGSPGAPAVSVIVAAWNAAATIERALGSLASERDVAFECIVVDDGSTDGTGALVARIAAGDERFRLVSLPRNEGVSMARNRGLAEARGEWLAFLDADDRLTPGALATLHRAAVERDALAVIGQRFWTDGERTWITRNYDNPDIRRPGRKSLARDTGLVYYLSTTSKLIHRSLVDGLTFEGRVLGDQPWTACALIRAGDRIEVIGDDVYEWIRPLADEEVLTITSAKGVSIDAASAVAVAARVALLKVIAEADRSIADPTERQALVAAYAERLIGADIGRLVARESGRATPGVGRLYRAAGDFLDVVPDDALRASNGFIESLLAPPLRAWGRLPASARLGAARLVRFYPPRHGSAAARRRRRRILRLATLALQLRVRRLGLPLGRFILAAGRPTA